MKKFYSTAIAVLCALGASAAINASQPRIADFSGLRHNITEKLNNIEAVADGQSFDYIELKKISSRAEDEAPQSIAGKYYINIGDIFFDTSVGDVLEVATIQQDGNKITITCDFLPTPIGGVYDAATGTISFSKIKLGKIEIPVSETEKKEYYLQIEPFTGVQQDGPVTENFTVKYDAKYNLIQFPAFHGFCWNLYTDSRYGIFDGYLDVLLVYDIEAYGNWTYMGAGLFSDNNMAAAFLKEPIPPYYVDVYKSNVFPDYFKVMDPWKGVYEGLGFKGSSPSIYLDAEDHDNVMLDAVTTGISFKSDGEFVVFNQGWYNEYILKDPSATEAFTTLTKENDMLVFTFEPLSLMLMGLDSNKFYYAGDENNESTLVVAAGSDENSGVSDVAVDANAPVEYFNLQGVRIDKPAAGQIVIKRQGAKVTKTIVR
ncbi:MAG: hypothetical protein K2I89_06995 [Muribaculaceae bacterium]|nr:hypothetical protein [Muribaculaceae bacterium]